MSLIAMQCKNCGGSLQVDPNAKSYYCPHCRTTYAMEQNITQNFQTTQIGHIETQNIIDDGSGKIDQEIQSGEAHLALRNYDRARTAFLYLTDSYAHKYRAWWGLARAMTEEFTLDPTGKKEFDYVSVAMQNAIQLAPAHERASLEHQAGLYQTQWQSYSNQLSSQRSQRLDDISRRTNEYMAPLFRNIEELQTKINAKTAKLEKLQKIGKVVPLVIFILFAVIIFFSSIKNSGVIGSLFTAVFGSGIVIFLPLKLIFFLIIKSLKIPTELMINSSRSQIDKIETDMSVQQSIFDNETLSVMIDTGWLDR